MLSIGVMSSGQASYYLQIAKEDYYLEGGEPPGLWFGHGAELLGLKGAVESNALYNLFAGRSPDGSRGLVQLQRQAGKPEHRPGWDLTFSAPKTVSVFWSQADVSTRRAVQFAHESGVRAALAYLEETVVITRRGHGGRLYERAGLIVALFEHCTSRALDPQLHTHALVMNLAIRADGTSGTLDSRGIFHSKMTAGALYRAEFSRILRSKLGLELRRERSWFEICAVSPKLVETFSKRRSDIEASLRKSGQSNAVASAAAAIDSRSTKEFV